MFQRPTSTQNEVHPAQLEKEGANFKYKIHVFDNNVLHDSEARSSRKKSATAASEIWNWCQLDIIVSSCQNMEKGIFAGV